MRDTGQQAASRLKLHAIDMDDLAVLSAAVSSATVKRGDMGFDKRKRRFALMTNRFRWEGGDFDGLGGSRIRCGIQINDVDRISQLGLSSATPDTVLELLAVRAEAGETEPEAVLTLDFAGGAAVRLHVGCIDVLVDDMGRAWYTPNRPQHGDDDQGGN